MRGRSWPLADASNVRSRAVQLTALRSGRSWPLADVRNVCFRAIQFAQMSSNVDGRFLHKDGTPYPTGDRG